MGSARTRSTWVGALSILGLPSLKGVRVLHFQSHAREKKTMEESHIIWVWKWCKTLLQPPARWGCSINITFSLQTYFDGLHSLQFCVIFNLYWFIYKSGFWYFSKEIFGRCGPYMYTQQKLDCLSPSFLAIAYPGVINVLLFPHTCLAWSDRYLTL